MIQGKTQRVVYYRTFEDDFVFSANQDTQAPSVSSWVVDTPVKVVASKTLYPLALLVGFVYCKIALGVSFKNRSCLKQVNTGYFLFGNHTQPVGDACMPSLTAFPKRASVIASAANLGIPVIGKYLPLVGALVIPEKIRDMRNFNNEIEKRISNGEAVAVYPEAHVWPWCCTIRPFPVTAFNYPIKTQSASFVMTTTYQKRKLSSKAKATVYLDGPFYPNTSLSRSEQKADLRNQIFECMQKRSSLSTYSPVHYEKEGGCAS